MFEAERLLECYCCCVVAEKEEGSLGEREGHVAAMHRNKFFAPAGGYEICHFCGALGELVNQSSRLKRCTIAKTERWSTAL